MKRILALMLFMIAVVCYATPPPDVGPQFVDQTVMVSTQTNIIVDVPVYQVTCISAPEVAFVYLGDCELYSGADLFFETESPLAFAEIPVPYIFNDNIDLNKPPSDILMNGATINNHSVFQKNNQNSNYGYPLTAD
jgi:hypothetical protein